MQIKKSWVQITSGQKIILNNFASVMLTEIISCISKHDCDHELLERS